MYRVVLVDDERIIVEGLKKVVQWEQYGCQVVATAADAAAGAEAVRKYQPHILFTDIRMTGENGMEMLAGLRSEFPDMQVTVLTGYQDFSYAQEAIKLGVTRFLLKPSRMAEINEALEAMVARLDRIRREQLPEQDADQGAGVGNFIVNRAMEYMRAHFNEKLTLQGVADNCYVSQWHLSKLLNRFMEQSFYDVLNEIRIEEARKLLANPGLKVSDICRMVGYTDNAHFARIFRKMTGMSANEYRNTLKRLNND